MSVTDLQPRRLIVTLFGLYARTNNNWLAVASVIRMMNDLGVDAPAVRSSMSRLKRRDVLESVRHDRTAGYSPSQATLEVVVEGDIRIFERERATLNSCWLIVVFSIPESERHKRHTLRTELTHLGFGTVVPGVWIAPENLEREARSLLARQKLLPYVNIFRGEYIAFDEIEAKVRSWWNFEELTELYADFIARFRPILDAATEAAFTPRDAFRAYIPILTQWRRLPYLDPGLPRELLPPEWNGATAEKLFHDLAGALSGPAMTHAMTIVQG